MRSNANSNFITPLTRHSITHFKNLELRSPHAHKQLTNNHSLLPYVRFSSSNVRLRLIF